MKQTECEVKFKISDPAVITNKLLELGATDLGQAKELDLYLTNGQSQVRIRKSGEHGYLTIKKSLASDPRIKVKEELEVKTNDPDTLINIFQGLGFTINNIKEKNRHTFKLDNTFVLIDQLPFIGLYLEIEGNNENELKLTCEKLGLDINKASNNTYSNIFRYYYLLHEKELQASGVNINFTFEAEKQYLQAKAG